MSEKPVRTFNHLRGCRTGNFDFCHPQDVSVCFDFTLRHDAPEGLCRSYSVKEDRAPQERPAGWSGEDLIALVDELVAEAERAIYDSSLKGLKALRQYLDEAFAADERDELRYEIALAEYDLPIMEAAIEKRRERLARHRRMLAECCPEEVPA